LAARLELISKEDSPETGIKWLGMNEAQERFWLEEKARLYAHFSD
jgi:hypothetical protein